MYSRSSRFWLIQSCRREFHSTHLLAMWQPSWSLVITSSISRVLPATFRTFLFVNLIQGSIYVSIFPLPLQTFLQGSPEEFVMTDLGMITFSFSWLASGT